MENSGERKVFEQVRCAKRGTLFFVDDFAQNGSAKASAKALERLTKEGKIVRVARGLYVLPKKSKLFGYVIPSIESIAEAIARRDKARIIPTGAFALNILGLSTQVPIRTVYLTDGIPRKINLGNRELVFKKTAPKNLAAKGEISKLVIQALRTIGNGKVTDEEESRILDILKNEKQENIHHDLVTAPEWIRIILRKAL